MKKNIILRILFTCLLLLTFLIIFYFSSQNGTSSGGLSRNLMRSIASVFTNNEEKIENAIIIGEPILRKIAHFAIYTSVGIWTMCMMTTYFEKSKKTYDELTIKRIIISTLIGCAYAISDEIHQFFISNRSAKVIDVVLDTIGVANGALIVALIIYIYKNKHYKNITKNIKKRNNQYLCW